MVGAKVKVDKTQDVGYNDNYITRGTEILPRAVQLAVLTTLVKNKRAVVSWDSKRRFYVREEEQHKVLGPYGPSEAET